MTNQRGGTWIRRFRNSAVLLLACGMLASCATFVGPRQVEIPLHKLQAGVERRFPLDNRTLELFDIRLSRPRLSLLAGSDRVALDLEAYVAPSFLTQSWTGSLALSGRLFVDVARGAVFMADARIDKFVIDGVDEARQRQFGNMANLLMDKVIRDLPVYSFRMEDLRYGGVQFVPIRISTTPAALVVTLEPVR